MKRPPVRPSPENVRDVFDYEASTGLLKWKYREGSEHKFFNTRFAGNVVGTDHGDYLTVHYLGANYYLHRIVWKIMTGRDPNGYVDHIDGDGRNNRWENLRDVSHNQNMWNAKLFHNNTSGYRGVSFIKSHQKWRAAISVSGKKRHLGYFRTPELAHAAFKDATSKMRDEFARVA